MWIHNIVLVCSVVINISVCSSNIKVVQLSCQEVKSLVDGHNAYRMLLAQGELVGQPKAANMKLMVWDDEMAAKAQAWAATGIFEHNEDTRIKSKRFQTGENLYMHKTINPRTKLNMSAPLEAWFSEHKDFQHAKMSMQHFMPSEPPVGHYTQMVWADSVFIGCGVSQKREGRWTTTLYVCNYGPTGNYIRQYPYRTGKGCESLCCSNLTKCDALYGEQC